LLRAAGDHWQTAQALMFLEYNLMHTGRFAEAASCGEQLEPLARGLGHPMGSVAAGRAPRMRRWSVSGFPGELAELGRWDYAAFQELGWRGWGSTSCSFSGLAEFLRGDLDAAEANLARAMELVEIHYFEGVT